MNDSALKATTRINAIEHIHPINTAVLL